MENININLTENEIQTLLDEALTGELHEVFEWNFTFLYFINLNGGAISFSVALNLRRFVVCDCLLYSYNFSLVV